MKNIEYYIEQVKKAKIDGGIERTKAYPFFDDNVILVNKFENDFDELKKRIQIVKNKGVSIPLYIEYEEKENECWILEELAVGQEFAQLVNNENGYIFISNIPQEHITKYINDAFRLSKNGIGIEPRRRNIFYDKNIGFTTIDVSAMNLDSKNDENDLEEVSYFYDMMTPIFNVEFPDTDIGIEQRKLHRLKLLKAFEEGHPFFKKYEKIIILNDGILLEQLGIDVQNIYFNEKDKSNLITFINNLIEKMCHEKIENGEYAQSHIEYKRLLQNAIDHCVDFSLFDTESENLEQYIERDVSNKIKKLFFANMSDVRLKNAYINIRRKELDPFNLYDSDEVINKIYLELEKISKNFTGENKEDDKYER